MVKQGEEKSAGGIPDPPTSPPLLVIYETRDAPGVMRHETTEIDIVRAHLAVSRLFERDADVGRVWIINAVQEILRPDAGDGEKATY